jgi:hypothetical protein
MHVTNKLTQPSRLFYGSKLSGIEINCRTYHVRQDRQEISWLSSDSVILKYTPTNIYTGMEDLRFLLAAEVGMLVAKYPTTWKVKMGTFDTSILTHNPDSCHKLLEIFPPKVTSAIKRVSFSINGDRCTDSVNVEFFNYRHRLCDEWGELPRQYIPYERGERLYFKLPDYCWEGDRKLYKDLTIED